MTSIYAQPLGTPAELAKRLKRQPPVANSAEEGAWQTALIDASNHLRDVIGQPLTAAVTAVDLAVDDCGYVRVPFCPVRSVDVVLDAAGVDITAAAIVSPGTGNRVIQLPAYAADGGRAQVTVSHGFTELPGELQRWVYMLAAARIADVDGGTLGVGGPTSVTVDDARVGMDNAGTATEIPDAVQERLRASYGGMA